MKDRRVVVVEALEDPVGFDDTGRHGHVSLRCLISRHKRTRCGLADRPVVMGRVLMACATLKSSRKLSPASGRRLRGRAAWRRRSRSSRAFVAMLAAGRSSRF
jgi:hypothetical protein